MPPGALPGSLGGGFNTEITCEEIASSAATRTQRGHNRGEEEGGAGSRALSAAAKALPRICVKTSPEEATTCDFVQREDKGHGVSCLEHANELSVAYSYSP